jgi:hypothetical protein
LIAVHGILLSCLLLCAASALPHEVVLSAGGGSQPGSDQANRLTSVEVSFYTLERSPRQHLQVGVSYTRLRTDAGVFGNLYAVSVYPQLSLYPGKRSKIATHMPAWAEPYLLVRALGPSYISENTLGTRSQDRHFAFLAQVGVGVLIDINDEFKANLSISWRHFSNANLFSDNDGIDVPFVLGWGIRF